MTFVHTTPTRILIVDDHPIMRDGLVSRITREPDLTVCGEADDVAEALELVAELCPDLVIIDLSLKTCHGIDLIKQIRKRYPKVKMLVNSMYEETVYAERSLHAGAQGYLSKQTARVCLIDAIRTVLANKTYLSPEMTEHILMNQVGGMGESQGSLVDGLTDRELEVLTLIGHGLATGTIANRLLLSTHTIDTYREKLKTKLRLDTGAELNRFAVQWVLENE